MQLKQDLFFMLAAKGGVWYGETMLLVDSFAHSRPFHACALRRRLVLSLGLVCAPACGDDAPMSPPTMELEPPEVETWHATEHIDVALLSDEPLCAGTLAMMDDHVRYVLDILELELEERITVYLWPSEQPLSMWCGPGVGGCTGGTTIYTNLSAVPHELVHAATRSAGHGSWFVEGVANGLDSQTVYNGIDIDATWELSFGGSGHSGFGGSGHFSRWLIDRFGGETYMDVYRQTPYSPTQEAVEAATRAVLDTEFDELLREYAATAAYVYPEHWGCYAPPDAAEPAWVDGFWDHEVHLDCDRADTFSSWEDLYGRQMTARVPITIPADGRYIFVADHPDAALAIQPCLTEPAMEPILGAGNWPIELFGVRGASSLRAGPHVLQVHLPPGSPADVRLLGYPSIQESGAP